MTDYNETSNAERARGSDSEENKLSTRRSFLKTAWTAPVIFGVSTSRDEEYHKSPIPDGDHGWDKEKDRGDRDWDDRDWWDKDRKDDDDDDDDGDGNGWDKDWEDWWNWGKRDKRNKRDKRKRDRNRDSFWDFF